MENKNHMEHPSKTFMRPIAHIRSNFPSKFGIPRQSGIVTSLKSTIVFEPEFRNPEALRGLEEFSHIWLIWEFSQSARPVSAVMKEKVSLPPAPLSVPILSACPAFT